MEGILNETFLSLFAFWFVDRKQHTLKVIQQSASNLLAYSKLFWAIEPSLAFPFDVFWLPNELSARDDRRWRIEIIEAQFNEDDERSTERWTMSQEFFPICMSSGINYRDFSEILQRYAIKLRATRILLSIIILRSVGTFWRKAFMTFSRPAWRIARLKQT